MTLSTFLVAPFIPGGSGPAPSAKSAQNLGAGTAAAADTVAGASAADASSWSPQPATYGTGSLLDLPVTMSDGTVLRADVYFPTTSGTTTAAPGLFPVLLQQTPYGKAFIVDASAIANTNVDYLVDRGYIVVIADVRGTGDSGGTFDLFDPVQSTDGVTLAKLGGASAAVERRGRPLRRVLHGHQPVPDGAGGRRELSDQGHVPHHLGQRPVRRHGDAGRHPRHRVRRDLCRAAVRPQPHQPRPGAAGGGGRERQLVGTGQRAGRPGAHRVRAQPGPRLVPQARPRRGDRPGRRRLRPELLGGAQPGAGPVRRRAGQDPGLPGRRVERPLRTGRAAQLRRPAEPVRRPLAVRGDDARARR